MLDDFYTSGTSDELNGLYSGISLILKKSVILQYHSPLVNHLSPNFFSQYCQNFLVYRVSMKKKSVNLAMTISTLKIGTISKIDRREEKP